MSRIEILPAAGRVVVRWRGRTIVDTTNALELREGSYPPVLYVPREAADMAYLTPTERHSSCPWKGEASYLSLSDGEARDENAVWSYVTPKPDVAAIAGHLAFYPDKVEISRTAA